MLRLGSSPRPCRTALFFVLLQQLNLPVPNGAVVNDFDEAAQAARSIGYEVVLKSPSGSNSVGVVTSIKNCDQLPASYSYLRRRFPCGPLLLEKMLDGRYFRILIVDGKFIRASSGRPSRVCATGKDTVRDLMMFSPDMFEGVDDSYAYRLEGLLLGQELTLDSVPAADTLVNITPVTA
jgi:cyanophycin synthetase